MIKWFCDICGESVTDTNRGKNINVKAGKHNVSVSVDTTGEECACIHCVLDAVYKLDNRIKQIEENKMTINVLGEGIPALNGVDSNNVSDGYHTFGELYEFRKLYNAALYNEWAKQGIFNVHKSTKHNDGKECFGGGWFVVVAVLPTGQISNHYELLDWDLFQVPIKETVICEFDGHTAADVLERLKDFLRPA